MLCSASDISRIVPRSHASPSHRPPFAKERRAQESTDLIESWHAIDNMEPIAKWGYVEQSLFTNNKLVSKAPFYLQRTRLNKIGIISNNHYFTMKLHSKNQSINIQRKTTKPNPPSTNKLPRLLSQYPGNHNHPDHNGRHPSTSDPLVCLRP